MAAGGEAGPASSSTPDGPTVHSRRRMGTFLCSSAVFRRLFVAFGRVSSSQEPRVAEVGSPPDDAPQTQGQPRS